MKMDMVMLCTGLKNAEEAPIVKAVSCNAYLLEKVMWPLMRGETVRYDEIDFEKFDVTEIEQVQNYCEQVSVMAAHLEQVIGDIAGIDPVASSVRQFC